MSESSEIVRELIDKQLVQEIVVPSDAATAVLESMERDHPREFQKWLRARAHQTLRIEITNLWQSQRSRERNAIAASSFSRATSEDIESGFYSIRYCISEDFEFKRLADMTGSEHLFVAAAHEHTANKSLMEAAFHQAVAKKAGNKRTADVMTEEECERLYKSITTKAAGRAA